MQSIPPQIIMRKATFIFFLLFSLQAVSQDTLIINNADTSKIRKDSVVYDALRIINMNPYFTLHADSLLQYNFEINKPMASYYWFLKNAPVGFKLDKATGLLYFKADKSFFKSGKLKYDTEYRVSLGVQSLVNPSEKVDTFFTILFYNTEIIASKIKPTIANNLQVEEGDSVRFNVQCEMGSFPTEQITMLTNIPISQYTAVKNCDDLFSWMVPFDFIKDDDTAKQKTLQISFIGSDKFFNRDTATIRILVKPGINYPLQNRLHKYISDEIETYVANLKLTFYVLSASVKKTKSTRTVFDISSSTTALAGTVLATSGSTEASKDFGKILPSVGLTLVPVKEAVAPNKIQEQNIASQVRTVARRLEYLVSENALIGERDISVLAKTKKLQEELKQARLQMIDLPVEFNENVSREDAERYFQDPKVNKKYKLNLN